MLPCSRCGSLRSRRILARSLRRRDRLGTANSGQGPLGSGLLAHQFVFVAMKTPAPKVHIEPQLSRPTRSGETLDGQTIPFLCQ